VISLSIAIDDIVHCTSTDCHAIVLAFDRY